MAGTDNLKGKGFESRTTNEQREIARAGGIASGAARRKRRDMKTRLSALLAAAPTGDDAAALAAFAIDDPTMLDVVCAALVRRAADGNVAAIQLLANLTGDDPYVKARQAEVRARRDDVRVKRADLQHRVEMDAQRAESADDIATAWLDTVIQSEPNA